MFKGRKKRSEEYQEHIKSILKAAKPNGGQGYDAEEQARIEQAAQMHELRRHVNKKGRVVR